MKNLLFSILIFLSVTNVFAQKNPNMVYAVEKTPVSIALPSNRNVYGGTIINVTYKGSHISNTIKGAFEYACKLVEENIPTTFPLNITMEFANFSDASCLAQVETYSVSADVAPEYMETDKVYVKRSSQTYGFPHFTETDDELSFFRDKPDASIKFSKKARFDYNLDQSSLNSDKYDFITVAVQALVKAVGFNIKAYASGKLLKVSTPENQFTAKLIGSYIARDEEANFQYATSGKACIYSDKTKKTWYLVSDVPYRQGISLNYFADSDDRETAIMQYGISKGSSIRYIGQSIRDFFSFCGWDRPIVTGMSNTDIEEANTSNVLKYQSAENGNALSNTPVCSQTLFSADDKYYDVAAMQECGSAGTYVLLKDGSWKAFDNLTDLTENTLFARTVDGYLRLKEVSVSLGPGGNYRNYHITYKLYDYLPQMPNAELNNVEDVNDANSAATKISTIENDEDEFVEVEIGIKNLEGTTEVLVEQTDSDYPVPFCYMVEDLNEGKFTAFMNKLYPSTFKLTYINQNGKTEGKPFTIDLRDKASETVSMAPTHDGITYKIVHASLQKRYSYQIINAINGNIVDKGDLLGDEGTVSTEKLKEGVYVMSISCNNTKVSEIKWKNN